MIYKILLKANFKQHKKSFLGIFIIMFITSICTCIALGMWLNSREYIKNEIQRMGYGDLTTWVSGLSDTSQLLKELEARADIKQVGIQPLIHGSYTINQQDSDSEGQLIVYEPQRYAYRFFGEDLSTYNTETLEIASGEIYISPSMISIFEADVGDEIKFSIGRSRREQIFVVKGFFEDPFMGSSMIGMKSFLINDEDFEAISTDIENAGIDALARLGAMVHLFKSDNSTESVTQWIGSVNKETSLSNFTEFAHSQSAIIDFMMLLQNVFAGFLLVFVGALLIVSILILGNAISSDIQRDRVNMGVLKAMGFTSAMLRKCECLQYLAIIFIGLIAGLLTAMIIIDNITSITLTTTGMLIPSLLPLLWCILLFVIIMGLLIVFIFRKTEKIGKIRPLDAILSQEQENVKKMDKISFIKKKNLGFWMALRQILAQKNQYLSAMIIAILLVFLAGLLGRVNTWLGDDGKGLMEAFNPAEHDIGVQYFGDLDQDELEKTILDYTKITDSYLLAMEGVTVNEVDYIANVIDEPDRFHILTGKTVVNSDEVVLTNIAAKDLDVWIGDTVLVSGSEYKVSGIYQCANDMGANIGMSKEGYLRIGKDDPKIWCTHYFVEDTSQVEGIIETLGATYGGDVHVHENSWPGLYGIINAMKTLMWVMYIIIAVIILVVIALVSGRLLAMESRNIGIYKALGFSSSALQTAFALRFAVVSFIGSIIGLVFSWLLTDAVVSIIMSMYGISSFNSEASFQSVILPALVIPILFTVFSFVLARAIRKTNIISMIVQR